MNKKYISLVVVALLLTACGGSSSSSSSKNDGKGDIDLTEYYPSKSMTKTYSSVKRDGDNVDTSHYNEIIEVVGNTITTTVDTKVSEKSVFSDTNITTTSFDEDGNKVYSTFRHVDLGDTIYSKKMTSSKNTDLGKVTTKVDSTCQVKSKESKFEKNDHLYTGDLLKIECISEGEVIYDIKQTLLDAGVASDLNGSHSIYNTSYVYLKKGIGEVASVDDDCVTNAKLPMVVNDKAEPTECVKKQYEYEFYLP